MSDSAPSDRATRLNEVLGIVLGLSTVIFIASLASYHPQDPSILTDIAATRGVPVNWIGAFGASLAALTFQLLGLAGFVLPVALGIIAFNRMRGKAPLYFYSRLAGFILLLACTPPLLAALAGKVVWRGEEIAAGGFFGDFAFERMTAGLNLVGTLLVLSALFILAVLFGTEMTFSQMFTRLGGAAGGVGTAMTVRLARWQEQRSKDKHRETVVRKHLEMTREEAGRRVVRIRPVRAAAAVPDPQELGEATPPARPLRVIQRLGRVEEQIKRVDEPAPPRPPRQLPLPELLPPLPHPVSAYDAPSTSFLDYGKKSDAADPKELMDLGRLIAAKSREFAVEGEITEVQPGPVVTTYEFKPSAGIKYARIVNLADDLALALKAESIRIERIPGRSTVGIELPNRVQETISLREIIESEAFRASPSRLTLALGKTIHGDPYVADLERMPHLLIAGSTGSGKSVGLNSMIVSMLYKSGPDDVKFVLIDPKMVELGVYADIPHLLTPIVTDVKKAANALKWAVSEMELRYQTLAYCNVRNIAQYNRVICDEARLSELEKRDHPDLDIELKPLPYIVVIIDELADLMMVAPGDIEGPIGRLTQMARAVGIHLILATQRPSVDVITGVIKSNLPARISFRVTSKVDSRTILDGNGAEKLLGRGDMLYRPPGTGQMVRVHGCYVSELEIARLIKYLKKLGEPRFNEEVTRDRENGRAGKAGADPEEDHDEVYDEAVKLVLGTGVASASNLQRRMKLGYNRAARLIDMMEHDGIVGPGQGAKPREILKTLEWKEEVERMKK